ncbi:uncharacterized protein LOC110722023 [Chenopodium quinoa]|uniref:uncharacterized protein LOC110722023 n=1 Tax=Chenopodium quinoa TaxID=63459 RepID=UPI000B79524C|nr:uncharacterized protein LOC110722023 [Chenopodium quinoa]
MLLNNALPLSSILQTRGIPINLTCVFCYRDSETLDHLFRDCSFVRSIWNSTTIGSSCPRRHDISFPEEFVDLALGFRSAKNWEGLVHLVTFWWAIWLACNHKIFRQAVLSPALVLLFMQDWFDRSFTAQEFRSLMHSTLNNRLLRSRRKVVSCCLTGSSTLSFNICLVFDGACRVQDCTAGAGLSVGLRAASRRGYRKLLIYTDCMPLFSLLKNGGDGDIQSLWLLQDIRSVIQNFDSCELRKVPRQWIAPAHWLATQARQRRFLFWSF